MIRYVSLILLAAIMLAPDASAGEKKIFTPEIMLQLRRVSELKLSPDGKHLLYNLGIPNFRENKVRKDLYMMRTDGSDIVQLTNNSFSESGAVFSPDGKQIAFVSNAEKVPQIHVMDLATRQSNPVTAVPEGVDNILWSPDGRFISFTSRVKVKQTVAEKYPDLDKAKVRIYDKVPIRSWDEWLDEYVSHLFIIKSNGGDGTAIDLMERLPFDAPVRPLGGVEQFSWSPDSKEIAYTSKQVANPAFSTNSDVYLVNIETKKVRNISEGMMSYDKDPLYSPDGKWIAFHSQERPGFESDRVRLMLYSRSNGKIIELSKTLDQWVGDMAWAPNSESLFFSAEDGPTVQLYQIDVADGKWRIITKGKHNFDGGLCVGNDGKTLYALKRDMMHSFEIYSVDVEDGTDKQISDINGEVYRITEPVKIEDRTIKAVDGKEFHTYVIYPPNFDKTKKYPLITYCQGGPQSTISQYFSLRWNLYAIASHGYVVVAPNRRGVPGFGQAWNDAISGDWGGLPMQDLLSATDEVSKEPFIDKSAMAAVGASAGGYAAYWLEGNHNNRFAAFVAHCGVFNMESMYGATEELFFPNWENGGPYWDAKAKPFYEKNSPHKFADKWNRPIMIVTGERDFRVPFTQSLEAFTVAQSKGLDSKIVIFPEENHWILHLHEQALWYREFFEFLDKHCMKNK